MEWRPHATMQDAMKAIPDGASQDAGFSTPDIYGRASQFYLALRKMQGAKDEEISKSEDVRLWRGLLTLLALRHHHNLPLRWEAVKLTLGDKVSDALREPAFEKDDLLFDPEDSEEKEYIWDGKNFYVLTWELESGGTHDLAVYSPLTLLYPVADWKDILKEISAHHVFLGRFYDAGELRFQTCSVLEKDERYFTDLWLKKMIDALQNTGMRGGPTPAARAVIQHLNNFRTDLRVASSSDESLIYEAFHAGSGSLVGAVPEPLWNAFQLQDGQVFSDQICILRVLNREGNPFSSRGCQYADKYEIKGVPDKDCKWYAFLPIHPERRDTCIRDGLAENISMQYRYDKKAERENIRVSIALPGTPTQVRDYPIENEQTSRKGRAVFYFDKGAELDMGNWPLFAVWPATIGQGWKEYYVACGEKLNGGLRIYGEAGTGWNDIGGPPVKRGHNTLAVKTIYVPDAIPLIRMMPGDDGEGETPVSIGIVTPKMHPAVNLPPVSAEVAVDFGTSSSRVYYQLTGTLRTVELFVQNDEPLEVTGYAIQDKDKHLILNRDKSSLMSKAFVSPEEPKVAGNLPGNPLFSMFRRSADEPQLEIPPILEGVIYQPDPQENLEELTHLITDLKWNGQNGIYFTPFMQQLCLHIMALLYKQYHVNRISWHYALPKSMGQTQVQSMRSIWNGTEINFQKLPL